MEEGAKPVAVDARIGRIADEQQGLVTLEQLVEAGLSRASVAKRVAAGRWVRVQPAVYRMAGSGTSWEQRVLAACLASGGVASHRSAAALWGLGFSRGEVVEVAVVNPRHPRLHDVVVHRATDLEKADVRLRLGIPVTDPARTIVDLGAVVPEFLVDAAVDAAVGRKLVSMRALRVQVALLSRRGRSGVGVLRRCLEQRGLWSADSELELLFERVVRRHDLPLPVFQYRLTDGEDRFVGRIDGAYPLARVAVEIDGYGAHASFGAFEHDRARQNDIITLGWRILRFTRDDLRLRDDQVARSLRQVLGRDLAAERARSGASLSVLPTRGWQNGQRSTRG